MFQASTCKYSTWTISLEFQIIEVFRQFDKNDEVTNPIYKQYGTATFNNVCGLWNCGRSYHTDRQFAVVRVLRCSTSVPFLIRTSDSYKKAAHRWLRRKFDLKLINCLDHVKPSSSSISSLAGIQNKNKKKNLWWLSEFFSIVHLNLNDC